MLEYAELVRRLTPLVQCAVCLLLGVTVIVFNHFFLPGNANEFSGAFIGIVFFTLLNNLMSIFNEAYKKYALLSYSLYFLLAAVLLLLAKYMAQKSIWQLPTFRSMFLSVTIFYFVTSVFVRLIRAIYQFALAEENEME